MKRLIWVVVFIAGVAAVSLWFIKRSGATTAAGTNAIESGLATPTEATEPEESATPKTPSSNPTVAKSPVAPVAARRSPGVEVATDAAANEKAQIRQSVDQLVSSQTSFEDKYHTWTKLRDAGKMDQVIAELSERATNNPAGAEYPAALGQAYLHKIAVTKDTRDYAVLGALADRSFDSALDIDPENWEARFFKATAMSYWPEEMNKRTEVIQRFTQLIQDQETKSPQPQFAQSYYWLGESYQKSGRSDYADQVWRRGAALFPNDPMLRQKLAGQ
jgi:tetratricopeptide (TPR) repeat protein